MEKYFNNGGKNFGKFNTNAAEKVSEVAENAANESMNTVAEVAKVSFGKKVINMVSAIVKKPATKWFFGSALVVVVAELTPKVFTGKYGHEYIGLGKKKAADAEEVIEVEQPAEEQDFEPAK